MLDEFRKSVNSILYERVTSPFWGAFAVSWIGWNWEVIYITFFVAENNLKQNKLEYIKNNHEIGIVNSILIPLIISLVIVSLVPLISNGVYWLSLLFKKWKINKKRKVEESTLLSFKESIEIRQEILNQEEKFNKLNIERNEKILSLSSEKTKLEEDLSNIRDVLEEQHKKNQELELRVKESIDNRNNINNFFSHIKWKYEVENEDSIRLQLYNGNQIRIGENEFDINVIKKFRNETLEALLLPRSYNDRYSIKFLNIRRSKNLKYFVGEEYEIKKIDENEYCGRKSKISIKQI